MTTDRLDTSLLERELLMSVIGHPDTLDDLRVGVEDFQDAAAAAVFESLLWLHAQGETVNNLTVRDAVQAAGKPCPQWVDEPAWVRFTDTKLAEFHGRVELRRTRKAAYDLVRLCDGGNVDSVRLAAAEIAGLQDAHQVGGRPRSLGELAVEAAQAGLDHEKARTLHLGLGFLQTATGGMLPGNMVVVGADTGVGKSSAALVMALGMAPHHPVGIVSCEDAADIWGARAAATMTGVSSMRIITGSCRDSFDDSQQLSALVKDPKRPAIAVDCQIGKSEMDVMTSMRRMARMGAKVLFVDYVQAIICSNKRAQRNDQVREIAARLKGQAATLGCGLVLLSQLRRPADGNKVREPSMHDLKETGDLENASDLIVLLWRPDPALPREIMVKLEKGKWGVEKRLHSMKRDKSGTLREIDPHHTDNDRPRGRNFHDPTDRDGD